MKKTILSLFIFVSVISQAQIQIPQVVGLPSALAGKVDKVTGKSLVADTLSAKIQPHVTSLSNPHSVTKAQVGLGNVDNTSDVNKPISTATQTALNAKEPLLPLTPSNPESRFLNGNKQWAEIVLGSGGYASNVYFTNLTSTIVGTYKQTSGTHELTETIASGTCNSNEVLIHTYLFEQPVGITTVDAGVWRFTMNSKINSNVGDSKFKIVQFRRSSTGVETDMFTIYSNTIENTDYQNLTIETVQPSFLVDSLDRFGCRIYATTTTTVNKIISYKVGDGYASYLNTPLALRHPQLRDPNGNPNVQHLTAAQVTKVNNTSGINTGDETLTSIKTKLGAASSSNAGYLTNTDWSTFNSKQPAGSYLTEITSGQVTMALGYTPWWSNNHPTTISGYGLTDLDLQSSINSEIGTIKKGGVTFIHDYHNSTATGLNSFIGIGAGNFSMSPSGGDALLSSYNSSVGYNALHSLTTGYKNSSIGAHSLENITSGIENVGMGYGSGFSSTTGSNNSILGSNSFHNNRVGSYNSIVGQGTGYYIDGGNRNTMIGATSGHNPDNDIARFQSSTDDDMVLIGYGASKDNESPINNAIAIGSKTKVYSSNQAVFGNDNTTSTILKGDIGVDVIPTAGGNTKNIELLNGSTIGTRVSVPQLYLSSNAVGTSYTPIRKTDGYAAQMVLQGYDGGITFNTASYGTAGSSVSWVKKMTLSNVGNLSLDGHVSASAFYGSGSNLTGIQLPITLTTNGTSGAATFSGNTLNIPNYTSSGTGGSFTSTYTDISNTTLTTATLANYTNVNGVISASVIGTVTSTATGKCVFRVSLPTITNSSRSVVISGTDSGSTTATNCFVNGDGTNYVEIAFIAATSSSQFKFKLISMGI